MDKPEINRIKLGIAMLIMAVVMVFFAESTLESQREQESYSQKYYYSDIELFDADKWSFFADRTAQEIAAKYDELVKDIDETDIYDEASDNDSHIFENMLSETVQNNIISKMNYYRWLAGETEVYISKEECIKLQDMICSENDTLEGLSDIGENYELVPFTSANTAVSDCMQGGLNFVDNRLLNSRMCVLSQKTQNVGFGYSSGRFAVCRALEGNGSTVYAFTSYPSPGLYPANDIDKELSAWHVELNGAMIGYDDENAITIEITDNMSKESFVRKIGDGLLVDKDLLVFLQPKESGSMYGHEYTVRVSGIETLSGKPAEIRYTVKFFDRKEYQYSDIKSVNCYPKVIHIPNDVDFSQVIELLPRNVEVVLDNDRIIEVEVKEWAQSVSWDLGIEESTFIAVLDDSKISGYILDENKWLRNISVKLARYSDIYKIVSKQDLEDVHTYRLSVESTSGEKLKDIKWYFINSDGKLEFVEEKETLNINESNIKVTYIALGSKEDSSQAVAVVFKNN